MKYDLYFEPRPIEEQLGGPLFTWGSTAVQAVAGPQKLYNRFLKKWLTKRNSNASRALEGTVFADIISGYNISDYDALLDLINLTITDAVSQVIEDDKASDYPLEEQMAGVSVESLDEDPAGDGFVLYIKITNQANASFTVKVPKL